MSAKPIGAEWIDDRDRPDHDPHGIVPDDFCRVWGAATIPEALAIAERAASSTPHADLQRCPDCESVKVYRKCQSMEMSTQKDEAYKCDSCGSHFDSPLQPREREVPGEQATFREVFRR